MIDENTKTEVMCKNCRFWRRYDDDKRHRCHAPIPSWVVALCGNSTLDWEDGRDCDAYAYGPLEAEYHSLD